MMQPIELITTVVVVGGFCLVVYAGFVKKPIGECLTKLRELISGWIKGLGEEE